MTSDPYRGLEYSILKNKSSKLFVTAGNITGAVGSAIPGLDKMTGFYSDFFEAAAYRGANNGLGLPYLSPGDIAIASQVESDGYEPNDAAECVRYGDGGAIAGLYPLQQLHVVLNGVISNSTLSTGAVDGNGTFTGITSINAGTSANPITIGTPNTGFIMQLGADQQQKRDARAAPIPIPAAPRILAGNLVNRR